MWKVSKQYSEDFRLDRKELTLLYVVVESDDAHENDLATKLGSKKVNTKQTDIYLADPNQRLREDLEETKTFDDESAKVEATSEEHDAKEIKSKSTIQKVMDTNWSPFALDQYLSDSDEPEDSSVASENGGTDFNSSASDSDSDVSNTSTSSATEESVAGNIFNMQFNELNILVESIQNEPSNNAQDQESPAVQTG